MNDSTSWSNQRNGSHTEFRTPPLIGIAFHANLYPTRLIEANYVLLPGTGLLGLVAVAFAVRGSRTAHLVLVIFFLVCGLSNIALFVDGLSTPEFTMAAAYWCLYGVIVMDVFVMAGVLLFSSRVNSLYSR